MTRPARGLALIALAALSIGQAPVPWSRAWATDVPATEAQCGARRDQELRIACAPLPGADAASCRQRVWERHGDCVRRTTGRGTAPNRFRTAEDCRRQYEVLDRDVCAPARSTESQRSCRRTGQKRLGQCLRAVEARQREEAGAGAAAPGRTEPRPQSRPAPAASPPQPPLARTAPSSAPHSGACQLLGTC